MHRPTRRRPTSIPSKSITVSQASPSPTTTASSNLRALFVVIGVVTVLSIILGGLLFWNYSRFRSYAHHTLTGPDANPPWKQGEPFTPEACVDAALDWAADCGGIKALCDEYATRVTQECLAQGDRLAYCTALGNRTATTEFGLQECYARGTRRHQDSESCSIAYRAIDAWCAYVRDQDAVNRGLEPIGPPTSTARPKR